MAKKDAALLSAVSALADVLVAASGRGTRNGVLAAVDAVVRDDGDITAVDVAPSLVALALLDYGKSSDVVAAAAPVVVALAAVLKKG